jgi:type VI secretion system protein ImpA
MPADTTLRSPGLPDLEKLLSPISGDAPGGEWLRYDPVYDQIRDARREDPELPQGVWKTELKKADWRKVVELCLESLESRSKDLQLAAWLTEAWTHRHGFPGASHGLRLLAGLCESFWEHLHPRPDGDDMEGRLAPLEWLDNNLPRPILGVAVTRPETDDGEVFTWLDWETAAHQEKVARRDGGREPEEEEGRPSQSKFMVSVSLTGSAFFLSLDAELEEVWKAAAELVEQLQLRCGEEAPRLTQSRDTLERLRRFVKGVLRQRMQEEDETMAEPAPRPVREQAFAPDEPSDTMFAAGGPIKSRAEAYRRLAEAADYLARTEPHSPTPHLVRRAVSWGAMTVTELLEELLADKADLPTVFKLLGIPRSK